MAGWWQRPSWREAPEFGPTHLCIAPDPTTAAGSLLSSVVRGVYLLEAEIHRQGDGSISLAGRGYTLRRGRAQQSVAGVGTTFSLADLLQQIRGVGRDLEMVAGRVGCFAAPTLLLSRRSLTGAPATS